MNRDTIGRAAMFEIGSSLREARLRQGLDFPELEQTTKIRGKYLRALEDEQFDVLPAQTYVKGFLRNYAEFLGLDGQLYVDEYNSRYVIGEDEPVAARPRRSQPARKAPRVQSRVVLLTILGIALVTGLVIVAWTRGDGQKQNVFGLQSTPAKTPAGTPATAKPKRSAVPVRLVIRAANGSSWIKVQRDPPRGALLFQSWLDLGRTRVFTGRWLRIEARTPDALTVWVNGKRAAFPPGAQAVLATTRGLEPFG